MLRRILPALVVCWSALLLFLIQPMMGKALLPWFGGSAGVWTTAMLFFQAVLLLGYAYAHGVQRLSGPWQGVLHIGLVGLSLAALIAGFSSEWRPAAGSHPAATILSVLALRIGLPYLVLSSTGPLMQAWWSRPGGGAPPYWLFGVSNAASLAALLLYPFVLEPRVAVRGQLAGWAALYGGFAVLACVPAARLWKGGDTAPRPEPAPPVERWLWAALAACPAVLWLAMANVVSQNIAPVPVLWILPLTIYLLSFILCFQSDSWYRPDVLRIALPLSWAVIVCVLSGQSRALGLKGNLLLLGVALFVCCMFCHGELARRKPKATQLTAFYLWVAAGGAMGGIFVGLIAPHLFDRFLELPIAVVACIVLGMRLLYGYPLRQVARLAVVSAVALPLVSQWSGGESHTRLRVRNFYGCLQVDDVGSDGAALRVLSSGTIHHGAQFLAPARSRVPITYYGPASGIAHVIASMRDRPLRIAVIGLGAGTLAAYGRTGDAFRFYEINPAVVSIARTEFRFLRESPARVDVVEGDGRLAMEREFELFDLIVLDAFSGDSIPTHLLTREAFAIYFARLKPGGLVAVHITNQYVDLAPVVRSVAAEAGRHAEVVRSAADRENGLFAAEWMLVKAGGATLQPGFRVWTDQYSNLFQVLK